MYPVGRELTDKNTLMNQFMALQEKEEIERITLLVSPLSLIYR